MIILGFSFTLVTNHVNIIVTECRRHSGVQKVAHSFCHIMTLMWPWFCDATMKSLSDRRLHYEVIVTAFWFICTSSQNGTYRLHSDSITTSVHAKFGSKSNLGHCSFAFWSQSGHRFCSISRKYCLNNECLHFANVVRILILKNILLCHSQYFQCNSITFS